MPPIPLYLCITFQEGTVVYARNSLEARSSPSAIICFQIMSKTNYQETATSMAKEHLDMLLRMETTLGRRQIRAARNRQADRTTDDDGY